MFILAYPEDSEHIAYFDQYFNKYIARGGTLAWRINNPGLVLSHSHITKQNASIGSCGPYAIFATPEQGYQALSSWLKLKKYYNSTIKTIAKHYQPHDPEEFLYNLSTSIKLPIRKRLGSFSQDIFESLMRAIIKLCNYRALGNEELSLLPKIIGKIECDHSKESFYLMSSNHILSLTEAINWIHSHRLDASIVHKSTGEIYLRSRPHHLFGHIRLYDENTFTEDLLPPEIPVETIIKTIGKKKNNQCIWGFINGISNTKARALRSAELISAATGGEEVLYLPNITNIVADGPACIALKLNLETPVIGLAKIFFKHLLTLSQQTNPNLPVIIFAHSQGAIIAEHALEYLEAKDRNQLRIFTLGGGSFIIPGKSHPDSHNYASSKDLICRLGSPHLQILALMKYEWLRNGLKEPELIQHLAMRDALLQIDSINAEVINTYT